MGEKENEQLTCSMDISLMRLLRSSPASGVSKLTDSMVANEFLEPCPRSGPSRRNDSSVGEVDGYVVSVL